MSSFGITEKSHSLLLELFTRQPEVEEVWLFGSRAKGTYKKGSDMAMANKANEELPIPYQVDIIDYSSIDNPSLKEHIDRVGKLFYSSKNEAKI